jgi:hypothetical protein
LTTRANSLDQRSLVPEKVTSTPRQEPEIVRDLLLGDNTPDSFGTIRLLQLDGAQVLAALESWSVLRVKS